MEITLLLLVGALVGGIICCLCDKDDEAMEMTCTHDIHYCPPRSGYLEIMNQKLQLENIGLRQNLEWVNRAYREERLANDRYRYPVFYGCDFGAEGIPSYTVEYRTVPVWDIDKKLEDLNQRVAKLEIDEKFKRAMEFINEKTEKNIK